MIGRRIRELRGNRPMRELAQRAGISISYWNDIEKGRTTPSIEVLYRIAAALECSLHIGLSPLELLDPNDRLIGE